MEDFLQKPEAGDAPISTSSKPWVKQVEYKSGKTPEGFAATAQPENVKAGFTYYDKEQKANFQMTGFTASIVAVLSGVSGTVPAGNNKFYNYWSSFVADTRIQKLSVFLGSGENRVTIASGIYNQFKDQLPDGVGYMKSAVCYIHETNECVLIELTAAVENSIKEAIAEQTGQAPGRINVFNLFELSTKFWAIRFSGSYTKRSREGAGWNGKGDMFFYPTLKAGVVLAEKFPILPELAAQVSAYIDAGQKYFETAKSDGASQAGPTQAAPQAAQQPTRAAQSFPDDFPTEEPPVGMEEIANVDFPDDWK